jgi:hypothetical protein
MLKKLLAASAALGLAALVGFGPTAHAATCGGTSAAAADGSDTVTTLPDGGHVYGQDPTSSADGSGYIGATGGHGYLELEGNGSGAQVDGSSTDAAVEGHVGTSGVCVNGTSAP